ncbi:MAG: acyl-CoA dehydrogenase, partial [Desulfobacterales bacterium]|nr:acyl-CoA dehydrogenase [Desulfobacterales bacterium]
DEEQQKDIDFLLILGELFTLVAYGQLIIENAKLYNVEDDLLDQIFDFIVRDFSKFALQLYSKTASTNTQMELCMKMIKKPIINKDRYNRIWEKYVYTLNGQYEMNP